jgi:hypothetical protein
VLSTWFYDPANSSITAGPPLAAGRAFHTATVVGTGQILLAGGNSTVIELCTLTGASPSCSDTGAALASLRCNAAAALVTSGPARVLVAGGDNCTTSTTTGLTTWDVWDSANAGTAVHNSGHPLNAGRRLLTATALGSGKVLLAGGATSASADLFTLNTLDLATSTVAATGAMQVVRSGHSATALTATTATTACANAATTTCVLIAGGNSTTNKTWEVYDASSNTFPVNATTAGNHDLVTGARAFHAAAAFAGGKVLLAGGTDASGAVGTTETFDPAAAILTWSSGAPLQTARFKAAAAYAAAQNVLVLIGGNAVGPSTEQVTTP